eukprot:3287618-Pleurochrysis_carterae.AAC.5
MCAAPLCHCDSIFHAPGCMKRVPFATCSARFLLKLHAAISQRGALCARRVLLGARTRSRGSALTSSFLLPP